MSVYLKSCCLKKELDCYYIADATSLSESNFGMFIHV